MAIPVQLNRNLRLPAIVAPMFIVSVPELVTASCLAGVIGTFPSLNARSSEMLDDWLSEIGENLAQAEKRGARPAPFGVNLIIHRTNPRIDKDLAVLVKHRVPLIITSLGAVSDIVLTAHNYGGVVFHDVINLRHSEKAARAGVDGLILVSTGAGGHAGTNNPFAFVAETRSFFSKTIILSGCIGDGFAIAGAIAMGADLAYMGTRFIASAEANADPAYKEMILASESKDIIYTDVVSGVSGNFLRASLTAAGIDPAFPKIAGAMDFSTPKGGQESKETKAWRDIWSAGQGCGSIHETLSCAELVARFEKEFDEACTRLAQDNGGRARSEEVTGP